MTTGFTICIATTGWWQHDALAAALAGEAEMVPLWSLQAFDAAGSRLAGIRALVTYTGAIPIDRSLIERLPALELIVVMGAGIDPVDSGAAAARGIRVCNCPAANTEDVAELAFGLLLAAGRGIVAADAEIRRGGWVNVTTRRLSGRPLGIFGMGNIGRAVARRAAGFDMPVFYTSRRRHPDLPWTFVPSLVDLARQVSQLVIAAPATPETRHAVSRAVLEALGPEGVLVNVARGSLVDQQALIDCLGSGRLGAAGLDVFDGEPSVPPALLPLPNVVLSPHNGGNTHDSFAAVLARAVATLRHHFHLPPP